MKILLFSNLVMNHHEIKIIIFDFQNKLIK